MRPLQMRCDIHTALADLNKEATELATKIQETSEEFGI